MILITSYYKAGDIERQKELDECLKKNVENEYINKIYLLNDKNYDLDFIENKNKIKQFSVIKDNKLNFKDAIEFINTYCYKDIVILSNSDIYFDNTLTHIEENKLDNKVYALLRYNEDENGNKDIFRHFDEPRPDSQDAWIFKSPLNIDLNMINFSFGTLGCDNIFASIINNFGYQLENPAYTIIIHHLHNIEERNYTCDDRIHGKYCLIYPHHLNEDPKITFIDY
jgi:hypothetical protein